MNRLIALYRLAEIDNIGVDCFRLTNKDALSLIVPDGKCYIAIDPIRLKSELDELIKLAHELGHCETGAFYNRYSALDIRQKHENRANRWAYNGLLPEYQIWSAVRKGYTEPWEIADYFNLPEPFVRDAMEYYQSHHEN